MTTDTRTHVPILSVDDVAALCDCRPDTVRALAAAGELPADKLGRDWFFPAAPLYEALCLRAIAATEQRAKARAKARAKPPTAVLKAVPGGRRTPPELPKVPNAGIQARP